MSVKPLALNISIDILLQVATVTSGCILQTKVGRKVAAPDQSTLVAIQ